MGDKERSALAAALDDIRSDGAQRGGGGGGGTTSGGAGGDCAGRSLRGGQYVILELLGKGAYGAVYKARR
jgi:hypothetical protein